MQRLATLLSSACFLLAAFISLPALAQQGQIINYSSGTGFFVSKSGHVITNEHVVRGCKSITVRGPLKETNARLVDVDTANDLALLRADEFAPRVATLRLNDFAIRKNDPVMLMGYPLNAGVTGEYTIAKATVIDVKGPAGEPKWMQFTDAAQKGNSGGPLLDGSGNVIGVVTAKTELVRFDRRSAKNISLGSSDVAVSLPILQKFLDKNRIFYQRSQSFVQQGDRQLERLARNFIVNVRCVQSIEPVSN